MEIYDFEIRRWTKEFGNIRKVIQTSANFVRWYTPTKRILNLLPPVRDGYFLCTFILKFEHREKQTFFLGYYKMIAAIWTIALLVAFFLLLAWQLGKDKGKEQGYFDGYKKGFSDAKFLSKMEHERQHQLETMINKNTFIKCEVCLKRHGKHKTIKQ